MLQVNPRCIRSSQSRNSPLQHRKEFKSLSLNRLPNWKFHLSLSRCCRQKMKKKRFGAKMQSGKWQVQLKGLPEFALTHDFWIFSHSPFFNISNSLCPLSLSLSLSLSHSLVAMHNALTFYFARKTCQWAEWVRVCVCLNRERASESERERGFRGAFWGSHVFNAVYRERRIRRRRRRRRLWA